MFPQTSKAGVRALRGGDEVRQPLLNGSHEHLIGQDGDQSQLLFSVHDEDGQSDGGSSTSLSRRSGPVVRFQEEVQVIGPPLRSTLQSREDEFELDSDNFDESSFTESGHDRDHSRSPRPGRRRERPIPLLGDFIDSLASRRTPEAMIPMYEPVAQESTFTGEVDLEEVAAKQWAGGGMLDSVANMANSILGADWTIRLVVLNAKLSGGNSYIEIMHNCFGPSGRAAVSLFQFTFAFGGMCAFGIIIGDTIPHNDTLINVARFCFGLNMFTTLPLELFVCREVTRVLSTCVWVMG
ncbi:hypothetical protein ID866_506 [Astraeus odoratus]|nr:hypothetical protein ID866_506 [Astraeus odoratus]